MVKGEYDILSEKTNGLKKTALIISCGLIISSSIIGAYEKKIDKMNEDYAAQQEELESTKYSLDSQISDNAVLAETNKSLLDEVAYRDSKLTEINERVEQDAITRAELEAQLDHFRAISAYIDEEGNWKYEYTQRDVDILAAVMYGENYISGRYEMALTGSVVLNRVLSDKFPDTIEEVVYQVDGIYEQYAPRTKNLIGTKLPKECYDLAIILLEYGPIAPRKVQYQAHFNQGNVFWDWEGEEFCYK